MLFNRGPLFYLCYNTSLFFHLLFHRYDILVANDLDTLPANFIISGLKRKILVYDSHEYFTEVPELVNRKTVKRVWEFIERLIVPHVKHAYTVCDSLAEIYSTKYGINMIAIRNLPYLSRDLNQVVKPELTREKIILYQGSVNIGRGLELVIKAMQYIDDAVFWIIGEGDITDNLRKLVLKSGLESRVVFFGRMLPENLKLYTLRAGVGISLEENMGLNYYYALPNKLFDYINSCVPVLVSDFPEMGQLVRKYNIGVTTLTTDPQKLAEILRKMLNDQEQIRRWKSNLKKAALELCWEKEESKLIGFYRQIISP